MEQKLLTLKFFEQLRLGANERNGGPRRELYVISVRAGRGNRKEGIC